MTATDAYASIIGSLKDLGFETAAERLEGVRSLPRVTLPSSLQTLLQRSIARRRMIFFDGQR